jgi:hypothetical protein
MKNLGNLMKQAQQMQAKMAEMQEKLAAMEIAGSAGGGMVQATVSGKGEVKRVKIDKSIVDPNDVEMLEDRRDQRRARQGRGDGRRGDAEAHWRAQSARRHEAAVLTSQRLIFGRGNTI